MQGERQALAGMLAMAAAMGLGRFAFTPLVPLMIDARQLSVSGASWLAAANYGGYLAGSLLATLWPSARSATLARASLLLTALCLAAMSAPAGLALWLPLRALAGMASAGAMVAASTLCLQHGHSSRSAPILYAGVGLGIVLAAWLVVCAQLALSPSGIWAVCALAAGLLGIWPWRRFSQPAAIPSSDAGEAASRLPDIRGLGRSHWVGLYALAGFGYIVGATYLPLIQSRHAGAGSAILSWSLFGLAAMPSCALWFKLMSKIGARYALALNLMLQALGAALPAWQPTGAAALAGTLCLGGGFMGTVVIAMPVARLMQTGLRVNLLGIMTLAYGLGQIAGPLCAQMLIRQGGNLAQALWVSALALALAAISLLPLPARLLFTAPCTRKVR